MGWVVPCFGIMKRGMVFLHNSVTRRLITFLFSLYMLRLVLNPLNPCCFCRLRYCLCICADVRSQYYVDDDVEPAVFVDGDDEGQ